VSAIKLTLLMYRCTYIKRC